MNDSTRPKSARGELRILFAVFATLAFCAYAYTAHTYGTDDWGRVARIIRILRSGDAGPSHVGIWTTPEFKAANFSAGGAMQWIVEPANVQTYAASIIGKTETVNFFITGTSIVGTPSEELRIAVPGGAKIAKRTLTSCVIKDGANPWGPGTIDARNAGSTIYIYRGYVGTGGNFSPSRQGTSVAGSVTFEIE